ncbi:MAG: Hpt domain-containing protein [Magnetospirillum sp.]|nr:Hpt domain-containing protein [Magnetospirillum sp.]
MADPIAEAHARFRARLPARVDEIETAWRAGDRKAAAAAAHRLAGAGATFGMPAAGDVAKRLEHAFETEAHDDAIARDIAALRRATEN